MVDHDGQVFVAQMFVKKVAKLRLRPNKMDPHRQGAAGENRPPDLRLGCFVGSYSVKSNVYEHRCSAYLAASFTSSTARPLYAPHLAQARWGSFFSWQFGHSESPVAVRKS
jgi:hypothetical protein